MAKSESGVRVRIPPITSVEDALRIYYQHPEITNEHIQVLFGKHAPSTLDKLKQLVKLKQLDEGVKTFQYATVNTRIAFEVWGLDIADLEARQHKLRKLGLLQKEATT